MNSSSTDEFNPNLRNPGLDEPFELELENWRGLKGEYPNIACPYDEGEIANQDIIMPANVHSMISLDAKSLLKRTLAGTNVVKAIEDPNFGIWIQVGIFVSMVFLLGFTPLVKIQALWDAALNRKVAHFVGQTPYIAHFSMSVVLANVIQLSTQGLKGVKDCWDWKAFLVMLPVSAIIGFAEQMEMVTLVHIDGTMWKILNQVKLPLTALIGWGFLGRKQTPVQWTLIGSVSIAIMTYCSVSAGASAASISTFGIILGLTNVFLATTGALVADVMYKKVKHGFLPQIAQGRLAAALVVTAVMTYDVAKEGVWWKLPFYGWNFRVLLLTIWLLMKDWSVTFVLKNLDSMWKALGTALGLVVTYFGEILLMGRPMDTTQFLIVLIIVMNIMVYAMTKVQRNEYNPLPELPDPESEILENAFVKKEAANSSEKVSEKI
eukprot:GHVP01033959.1.p1 GENE.GHVP01033959.1~~GHVP01033959.1.p1  ORF type:complete len:435 (-),score=65.44 GHVP01033959.1:618-1922(-)